jgi:hypothetical protein
VGEWGHVKISRKAFATDVWWKKPRVFSEWEAWEDCIQMAAWQPTRRVTPTGLSIPVERGQFVASLEFLCARWKWSLQRVRRWLKAAQQRTRLRTGERTPLGTLYSLVNYDAYQSAPAEADTPANIAMDTPANTNRNSKALKQLQTTPAVPAVNGSHPKRGRQPRVPSPDTPAAPNWVDEAVEIYGKHRGTIGHGKLGGILKPLVVRHTWERVRPAWEYFCEFAPVQDYLNRVEAGVAREGEQPVKKFGPQTTPTFFVENFTHFAREVET